jgi:hypothetical protein
MTVCEVSLCSVVQCPAAMLLIAANFRILVIILLNDNKSDSMIVWRGTELSILLM